MSIDVFAKLSLTFFQVEGLAIRIQQEFSYDMYGMKSQNVGMLK